MFKFVSLFKLKLKLKFLIAFYLFQTVLLFAAFFAIAAARPGHLVSSPAVYATHYVQPVVKAHYSVPVIKTIAAPVVHSAPLVHSVPLVHSTPLVLSSHHVHSAPLVHSVSAPVVHSVSAPLVHSVVTPVVHASPVVHLSPLYHSYGAVPVLKSYAPAYGVWKNKV